MAASMTGRGLLAPLAPTGVGMWQQFKVHNFDQNMTRLCLTWQPKTARSGCHKSIVSIMGLKRTAVSRIKNQLRYRIPRMGKYARVLFAGYFHYSSSSSPQKYRMCNDHHQSIILRIEFESQIFPQPASRSSQFTIFEAKIKLNCRLGRENLFLDGTKPTPPPPEMRHSRREGTLWACVIRLSSVIIKNT